MCARTVHVHACMFVLMLVVHIHVCSTCISLVLRTGSSERNMINIFQGKFIFMSDLFYLICSSWLYTVFLHCITIYRCHCTLKHMMQKSVSVCGERGVTPGMEREGWAIALPNPYPATQ